MTDRKPSPEGGARDPSPTSEPSPTRIQPARPIKPAQPNGAQIASTKPSPVRTTSATPIKPGQASAVPAAAVPPEVIQAGGLSCPHCDADIAAHEAFCEVCGGPVMSSATKASPPGGAKAAGTAEPHPVNSKLAQDGKASPANPQAAAPAKPGQPQTNAAQSTALTRPRPAKAQPAEPTKPAQPRAAQMPASTKPGPANRHGAAAFIKPSPTVTQRTAPAKPAQPNGAQGAASTKPNPAKGQPVAPPRPAQPRAAQTPASTKPGPANTHGAAALIKRGAAQSQPAVPTKPAQPNGAASTAPTKLNPTATAQPAAPTKPNPTAAAQPVAPSKPAPTRPTQATPAQANAAQTAAPTKPTPAVAQPVPATKPTQPSGAQTSAPPKPSPASKETIAAPTAPSPEDPKPAVTPTKRRRVLPIILASVAATLVAVLAVAALFVNRVEHSLTENLDREDLMPTDTAPHPTKEQVAADALNFVVMGYDSRDPSVERSSSLMILHLNAKRDQAYFITFPRDTWVSIPGQGNNRISAAYRLGGSKLAVSTLENLTDTRVDHAALVDIQGFAKLTDEVGGVTVYNKAAFRSHSFDYPKGNITVSGARAIYFVGERNALPRGDSDRAANERNLVRAIIAKTLSAKTMSDPGRLFSVVSGAAEHLTVDKGLTNSKIRSTIFSLRLSNKDVHLMNAPVSDKATKKGQRIDRAKMAELRTALRNDRVNEYLAKYPQG